MANCPACKEDIRRTTKYVKCYGLCGDFYHQKCGNVSDKGYAVLQDFPNFGWRCDQCMKKGTVDMFKMVQQFTKLIDEKLSKQHEMLMTHDEILKGMNEKIVERGTSVTTYANVAKTKKQDPVLVIKPKNSEQKNMITKNDVKKHIDPVELEVSGIRNISNGGILVECKNEEAVKKLKEEAVKKLGEDYSVSVPKKLTPRVKVIGLSEKLQPEQIEANIKAQNHYVEDESARIKVVHIQEMKDKRRGYCVYMEVDGKTYKKMLLEQKLNIGWDRCKVYDAVSVKRCYKCSGFNHKASECRGEKACPRCADNHDVTDCKAEKNNIKCINCVRAVEKLKIKLDVQHEVWSQDCAVYRRKLEIEQSKINFLD